MNNTQKTILLIVSIFAIGYILMAWSIRYNAVSGQAYSEYEACVERRHNMLPSTFYAIHGYAAECE